MKMLARILFARLPLAALIFVCAIKTPRVILSQDAAQSIRESESSFAYVGTDSCSASNCHGGRNDAGSTLGREYSIWIDEDPHANSYRTLLSPASQKIAQNLSLANAHEAKVCLDCHAIDAKSEEGGNLRLASFNRHTIADGVGCESCHGPAEKWLEPHSRGDWQYFSFAQKKQLGFNETSHLVTRGKTCAECHVGSLDKDMNHDLIASGHPRLFFELSAYEALLPKHWSRAEDKSTNSAALEAKLWSVGQVTSLIKALELLENRASRSDAPWPEFAEYGCYECHHGLTGTNSQPDGNSRRGKPIWASWQRPAFELLTQKTLDAQFLGGEFQEPYDALIGEMNNADPDRGKIVSLTRALRHELEFTAQQVVNHPWTEADLRACLRVLTDVKSCQANSNWDAMTQRYLGTVALRQALIDCRAGDRATGASSISESGLGLEKIRGTLYFDCQHDSPLQFDLQKRKDISKLFSDLGKHFEFGIGEDSHQKLRTAAPK